MKRKQPWLPEKPRRAMKCPDCKGRGTRKMWGDGWREVELACNSCGGKGFK